MNILELTTRIGKTEITVKLSNHTLKEGILMKVEKIHEIIIDEFDNDLSFELNSNRILNALMPLCFEVSISPPKTVNNNYKFTARK